MSRRAKRSDKHSYFGDGKGVQLLLSFAAGNPPRGGGRVASGGRVRSASSLKYEREWLLSLLPDAKGWLGDGFEVQAMRAQAGKRVVEAEKNAAAASAKHDQVQAALRDAKEATRGARNNLGEHRAGEKADEDVAGDTGGSFSGGFTGDEADAHGEDQRKRKERLKKILKRAEADEKVAREAADKSKALSDRCERTAELARKLVERVQRYESDVFSKSGQVTSGSGHNRS